MKLYIVQHGQAATKQENPLRPLTGQGINDIRQLASELDAREVAPRHIFHSGKERAQQTAHIIAAVVGDASQCKQLDGMAPNDDAAAFAAYIKPFAEDTLIVSHLPFVQNLCDALLGEGGLNGFEFSPGRLVCIDIEGHRSTLEWTVPSVQN